MMNLCETCPFEEKLLLCCPRFPLTGEQVDLVFPGGEVLRACPWLEGSGMCGHYADRPRGCREFFCDRFRNGERGLLNREEDLSEILSRAYPAEED